MAGHDETPALHEHSDSWHHHTAAEGMPQHEHASVANPSVLLHWFFLILLSGIVLIVALMMYFGRYYTMTRAERVETLALYERPEGPKARLRDADALLGTDRPLSQYSYKPADAQAHTVQLPIEQAMHKTIAKYQTKQ